jgi:DNA-binding beta-propeller fold protein YncE
MNRPRAAVTILGTCLATLGALGILRAAARDTARMLRLERRISLPSVAGRIDHLAHDPAGHRLFIAALGNNTVEVVDLQTSARVGQIPGFHEPQGLGWNPSRNELVVANGETGELDLVDGTTFAVVKRVAFGGDADNVRLDRDAARVFVGYGDGAIAALDAHTGARVGDVALGGHPESFQLSGADRLYANVPDRGLVAVVDRVRLTVVGTLSTGTARANYPMAIDQTGRRLFIGCRKPAVVLVFDLDTRKQVASVPIDDDTDDMFYDPDAKRLYVICGAGFVDVVAQETPDRYRTLARVPTAAGARTGLFVPALHRLFVAAPRREGRTAAILAFETGSP